MNRLATAIVLTVFASAAFAQVQAPTNANNGGLIQHDQTSLEAQQPAPAPQPAPQVLGAPVAGQVGMPADVNSLDRQLMDLANLKQQSTKLQAELQVETLKRDVATARGQSVGAANGTAALPQLVGIVSDKDGVVAEFLSGDAILRAHEGEWVSTQWRLTKVLANGVELSKKGSNARHTMLFGASGPVRGGLSQYSGGNGNGAGASAPAAQ